MFSLCLSIILIQAFIVNEITALPTVISSSAYNYALSPDCNKQILQVQDVCNKKAEEEWHNKDGSIKQTCCTAWLKVDCYMKTPFSKCTNAENVWITNHYLDGIKKAEENGCNYYRHGSKDCKQ